ncbi:MAG: PAS domain-containing protein [Candidatus Aureabacteria bacterium]|nr:PAS domain-containing protein [Candidatus Auribacterota bacterium]
MAGKAIFFNNIQNDNMLNLIKRAPFFIAVLDEKGRVVFFNKEAERVTGCSFQSARDKDFIETFFSQETKEPFRTYFYQKNAKKTFIEPFVCVLLVKGQPARYMEWTGLRSQTSGNERLILIGKDLTESLTRISDLLSQTLHDINNSATFIIGNMPFLREAWSDIRSILDEQSQKQDSFEIARLPYSFFKEDYPQVIEDIETGCRRMKNIVAKFKEIEGIINEQKKSSARH